MKSILTTLAILIAFCLGYFLKSESKTIVKEKEVVIKEVPKEITKEIIVEKKEDINLAKEYYEKAFKLFLINIGYSLNKTQESEFEEMIKDPTNYVASKDSQDEIQREFDFIPTNDFKRLVKAEEADLKSITDEDLLKDAQKFILKDPAVYFARSKFIKSFEGIKSINGEYRAQLFRMTGKNKGRVDNIYLGADYIVKGESGIDGTFTLKMSHGDKIYSDSNGSGGNGNVRIKDGNLVIEAGPSNFFHFKGKNIDEANFYSKGKFVGMARFQKI
jgi:hypothetical protein